MRRLTLILSDLYLPADAVRESFPTTAELPALEWLLRFASPPRAIGDWRSWLAREVGAAAIADWPVAHVLASAAGVDPAGTWVATPVRLEARLDHVRLSNRGVLSLTLPQLADLSQEFQATFGPEMSIAGGKEHALILKGGPDADLRTTDPARLLDADVGSALPAGPGAGELRRLGAEIEMWLPGTRFNAARQRAGLQAITALWLWGGGEQPARDKPAGGAANVGLYGSDPFLSALAILTSTNSLRIAPDRFEELGEAAEACAVFTPMSGPTDESLAELESRWFAPVRDALSAGRLESFRLVANDRVFDMKARAGWKFWRGKRSWLESLA
jgi:hypothetical protein